MVLTAALAILGAPAEADPLTFRPAPGGGVGFDLESTAGLVRGRADLFSATLDPQAGTASLAVEAHGLTTGLGPRDQRMLVYALDVAAFPAIRFDVARIEGALEELRSGSGEGALRLLGRLTIRDVAIDTTVAGTFAWEGESLRIRGEHVVSWSAFGIPDPSVLVAHVADEVRVHFDLVGSPG